MKRPHVIHFSDAIALLESGQRVSIKVWKMSTGDIIHYNDCICIGQHRRGGTHMIECAGSSLVREFRDVTLFEINGLEIYR